VTVTVATSPTTFGWAKLRNVDFRETEFIQVRMTYAELDNAKMYGVSIGENEDDVIPTWYRSNWWKADSGKNE
jgi:hypothetical protein